MIRIRLAPSNACAVLLAALAVGSGAAAPGAQESAHRAYPKGRAAELKTRLLEHPGDPTAGAWAAEYVGLGDLNRLDPVARAAERLWAARVGLRAPVKGSEKKRLEREVRDLEKAPLDSSASRRAENGLRRIGVVVPLSGKYERFGRTFVNGLRLALDQHNRAAWPTLSLVLHDSEGDPLVGARKARWLLRDHGISVIVGELLSANTAPLAAATQVVGAVLISPSATNERLAILGDGVFQFHVSDRQLAETLLRPFAAEKPAPAVAILAARTAEDSARAEAAKSVCASLGLRVTGLERLSEGDVDAGTTLAALRSRKAAVLVLLAPPRLTGIVASQIPGAWPGVRVVGMSDLDPEPLGPEARGALEGAVFVTPDYALRGAVRDSFEARYRRMVDEPPTRMSVRGYLSGLALVAGIEAGAFHATILKDALRAQLVATDEGRRLRALSPAVPAEPERYVVREGRAVSLADRANAP